jgi:hypothetical protein
MDSACSLNKPDSFDEEFDRGYQNGYEKGKHDKENGVEGGLKILNQEDTDKTEAFLLGIQRGYFHGYQ